jgi:hypothetical protein
MASRFDLSELGAVLDNSYDAFVCCASFETRCRTIADSLGSERLRHAYVFVDAHPSVLVATNFSALATSFKNRSSVFTTDIRDPLVTTDAIQQALISAQNNGSKKLLVDITTFTHESVLIMLKSIQSRFSTLDVSFIYVSAGQYSTDKIGDAKWLSKGIADVRSVLGFPGKTLPSQKLHLIVLAGFETERAQRLIERYEPTKISLGVGDPNESISVDHYKVNVAFHKKLAEQLGDVEKFTFSCLHPDSTAKAIREQVAKHPGYNTILAPMNTKLSTVGAGLAAMADNEIQLCYAVATKYNEENYSTPGKDVYLFQLKHLPANEELAFQKI